MNDILDSIISPDNLSQKKVKTYNKYFSLMYLYGAKPVNIKWGSNLEY